MSEYLVTHKKDAKAHKFLGQLYEREGDVSKALGCYKVKMSASNIKIDQIELKLNTHSHTHCLYFKCNFFI